MMEVIFEDKNFPDCKVDDLTAGDIFSFYSEDDSPTDSNVYLVTDEYEFVSLPSGILFDMHDYKSYNIVLLDAKLTVKRK